MQMPSHTCDLCGLSLHIRNYSLETSDKTYRFCCMGCKQVFLMLLEATESGDPARFKETDLFKKCLEMGIIPGSEAELRQRATEDHPIADKAHPVTDQGQGVDEPSAQNTTLTLQLKLSDMWCPACAWVIDESLKKKPGIVDSVCNFSTDRLRCEYDPVKTSPAQIIDSVEKLGYRSVQPGEGAISRVNRIEFIRFGISAFLTMNVMMLSFALYSGFVSELSRDAITKLSWPMFVMASVVMFYGGYNIFRKALAGFASAASSMETLIAVGSSSAYIYSIFNLAAGNIHLYFDTASMLITLVLLGKLLERSAKNKVQQDLESFFSLRPTKVRLCTAEYPQGRYLAADQLRKGDIFRVDENEIVPADGRIVEGRGSVDESALTGEALPVVKKSSDRIRSGTRVSQGSLRVKTEAVGQDCVLGQMIQIMENALSRKTPLEGKTDRILRWFVPVIIALAAGTGAVFLLLGFTLETALIRAVTVTVISCPCALGVAIPLARVAGISVAGRMGILVREFSAFEQAPKINTFVFDKTGTITKGQWNLQQIIPCVGFSTAQILSLAAALEADSDHPIALEIKRLAKHRQMEPATVHQIQVHANGVSGRHETREIKIGSKSFLRDEVAASKDFQVPDNLEIKKEFSIIYMSYGGRCCAVLVFGDMIRDGASRTIAQLTTDGHSIHLVSGDGEKTTREVAKIVGIKKAHGEQLPQEKADLIETLQRRKRCVAMVGDGVNDAPALAMADLAVAVHSSSHLGQEVADITLMQAEPTQILDFLQLADRTNRKVYQNLWCSVVYNFVSIPLAMSGLLTPLIAVCAMLLSSLSVTGNTLLLIRSYSRENRSLKST
jgi:heavy metal translocating P-type ATPase